MYPVLLKFGPIQIFTYGFFLALASLSAFSLAGREARRLGLPPARFYDLCFYIVLGALVGSRLLYVFLELPAFVAHPLKIFAIWEGGLIFHGGLVAAVAVTFTNPETLCPLREPLHPSQLYEALLSLGVFGVVYSLRTRKRFDGQLMLTYFFLAGAVRFVVEFFRNPGDYRGPIIWADMPLTQVVALGIALVSGILLWWFWSRAGRQGR